MADLSYNSVFIDNTTTSYSGDSDTISSSSSPISIISMLGQDHLFTVLLLLPVESIISFSMTCKRFRDLACSDSLWESICRREWGGSSFVDAQRLKTKSSNSLLPSSSSSSSSSWIDVYKQVSRIDSVACHNLSEDPSPSTTTATGEQVLLLPSPSPRASHSLNFVSDCLVLFGGGCEGGRHLDDTWLAYVGNNDFRGRRLKWQKVNSGFPSGRFGHTCVVIGGGGDFLVLFGGIDDHGNRQNDTWVGQVARHDETTTLGGIITLTWRPLNVGPTLPAARGAHAAASYVDKRKMVVHGGIGLYGLRLGDTWILELSEDTCFGAWHELVAHPSPPPRSGHTLTCIGGSQIVLFGGRGLGYEVLKDVWLLDVVSEAEAAAENNNEKVKWVQLVYDELRDIPQGEGEGEGASLPRVGHCATLVLGGRVLIYGGEDSYRHRKDDFWVLDARNIRCCSNSNNNNNKDGLVIANKSSWKRLRLSSSSSSAEVEGYKPKPRSFHRACADHSGRYLYVFGGMVDGVLHPAEASGLRFDGDLFLAELILH